MWAEMFLYYRCGKQIRVTGRTPCRPNHTRAEPLDELVWQEVRRHLLTPQLLIEAQTALTESASLDQSLLATQIDHTRKRLIQVNAERRRLVHVYQGGFIDKEEFESRASQLNRRVGELQADLQSLEQENQHVGASQSLSERLHNFTSAITHKLDTMSFHERQTLIRSVVEEVVINDNKVKLYLKIPLPKPKTESGGTPKPAPDPSLSTQFQTSGSRRCLSYSGGIEKLYTLQ